jgi:excisionase family DNA binding protein
MFEHEWMTEDEALEYLRMGGKYPKIVLRQWCRQGRIEFARLATHYRFRRAWLDAFLLLNGSAGARREASRRFNKIGAEA